MKNSLYTLIKFAVRLGIVGLIVLAVFWFARTGLRPEVRVAVVSRGVAIDAVPASITVAPQFDMVVTTDVAGRVKQTLVEPGQFVQEGEIIVEIDQTDLLLAYEQFKIDYDYVRARNSKTLEEDAELKRRQEDLENSERLFREGVISSVEIQRRREDLQLFVEQQELVRIARQQEESSMDVEMRKYHRSLEQTTVVSPHAGIITDVFAWPGELLNRGSGVAALYSERLNIEAKVNEENFSGIKAGQTAQIRFLTFGNRLYSGRVTRVLPVADPETQQYSLYLELDGDDSFLLAGLTGEASIIKNRAENSLIIPRRAMMGGEFVFVVNPGTSLVELRKIRAGYRALNAVQVVEGLEEGELVITDELDRFRDGDKVDIVYPENDDS